MKKIIFVLAALILIPGVVVADEILLKNGNVINGKIIAEFGDNVVIEIPGQGEMTFSRGRDVEKITYNDDYGTYGADKTLKREEQGKDEARSAHKEDKPLKKKPHERPQESEKKWSVLDYIIAAALMLIFSAISLWITIGIVDRGNGKNTFGAALFFSLFFLMAAYIPFPFNLVILLVVFFMILFRYYDVSFLRTVLAVIVLGLVQFCMAVALAAGMPWIIVIL